MDQAFQTYLLKEAFHHARRHTGDNSVAIVQSPLLCRHHRVGSRRAAQRGRSRRRRNPQRRQCHRGRAVQHGRTHTIRKRRHIAVVILEVFRHLAPHTAGVGIGQHGRGMVVRRGIGIPKLFHRRVYRADAAQKVGRNRQQRAANRRLLALIPRHLLYLGVPLRVLLPLGDIALIVHQLGKLVLRETGRQQCLPRSNLSVIVSLRRGGRNTLCACQHLQCGSLLLRQIVQLLSALDIILDALGFVQVGLHGGIVPLCFRLLRVIRAKGVDIIRFFALLCLFSSLFHLCAVIVQIKPRQPPVLLEIRLLLGLFVCQFLFGFLPIPRKGESAQKRTVGRDYLSLPLFRCRGRGRRSCHGLSGGSLRLPKPDITGQAGILHFLHETVPPVTVLLRFFSIKNLNVLRAAHVTFKAGRLHFLLVDVLPTHWPSSFIFRDSSAHTPDLCAPAL